MKTIKKILICLLAMISICASAQVIKQQPATADDYVPLLEQLGYKVYSFDISSLAEKNETYRIHPIIYHYEKGIVCNDTIDLGVRFSNRDMLAQYDKETQEDILKNEKLYDADKGIYKQYKKLTIGFAPSDAGRLFTFNISDSPYGCSWQMPFKKQVYPDGGECSSLGTRVFKLSTFKLGEFTPLTLIGSYWYDSDCRLYRFCGEDELSSEMKEDYLKLLPEFYVIGVEITK